MTFKSYSLLLCLIVHSHSELFSEIVSLTSLTLGQHEKWLVKHSCVSLLSAGCCVCVFVCVCVPVCKEISACLMLHYKSSCLIRSQLGCDACSMKRHSWDLNNRVKLMVTQVRFYLDVSKKTLLVHMLARLCHALCSISADQQGFSTCCVFGIHCNPRRKWGLEQL